MAVGINVLSPLIKVALDLEKNKNDNIVFSSCNTFLRAILAVLDRNQLKELEQMGIECQLYQLLEQYAQMDLVQLEALLACMVTIAETSTASITTAWNETLANSLATIACMQPTSTSIAVQIHMWRLLAVHSRRMGKQARVSDDIMGAAVSALGCGSSSLSDLVISFLRDACRANTDVTWRCVNYPGLVGALIPFVRSGSWSSTMECTFSLLFMMIPIAPSKSVTAGFSIIGMFLDCARLNLDVCVDPTCKAICEIISLSYTVAERLAMKEFYTCDSSAFFAEALSHEVVYSNEVRLKSVYETLTLVLKGGSNTNLYSREFLSSLIKFFERDFTLPSCAEAVINMWLSYLPPKDNAKGVAETLHACAFHGSLTKALPRMVNTVDEILLTNTTCLLARLVQLYKDTKVDMTVVVKCGLCDFIADHLRTANLQKTVNSPHVVTNLCATLFDIILDKETCLELYRVGYVEKLVQIRRVDSLLILRCIVTALSNIACYVRKVQAYLIEKNYHHICLDLVKNNPMTEDTNVMTACCFMLMVLSQDDTVKKTLVASGCTQALMSVLVVHHSISYLVSRALGLLANLMGLPSDIKCAVEDVFSIVRTVKEFLHDKQDGYVLMNAALVFLQLIQLDHMIPVIRKAVDINVIVRAKNNTHVQGLSAIATMLVERLFLNCITSQGEPIPGCLALDTQYCWPPKVSSDPAPSGLGQCIPLAPVLDQTCIQQLTSLGLSMHKPLLRIGQIDGTQAISCGCHVNESQYDNLIVRPHGLTLEQYQQLIDYGWFRRGGVKLYRTTQCHDVRCSLWETRVLVRDFDYHSHKSFAKVMRRMPVGRLTVETVPAQYSQESHELYNSYNVGRHDKHPASDYHYQEHAVYSPIGNQTVDGIEYGSFHQLYRLDGRLVAVSLIDIVPKGIVSVYMWYSLEKEVSKYSLGVYSALKEIEFVRELSKKNPEMKYYYLQGWNENNKKLAYKVNYPPESFYCACITPEWLPSLEAVKKATEKYLREHTHDKNGLPSSKATTPIAMETTDKAKNVSPDVPCSAFENDRAKYQQLTGHRPDVSKMVVCLNYATYMYLGEVFSRFGVDKIQRELVERRFEELIVAIGPELGSQLVIDLRCF